MEGEREGIGGGRREKGKGEDEEGSMLAEGVDLGRGGAGECFEGDDERVDERGGWGMTDHALTVDAQRGRGARGRGREDPA